MESTGDDDNVSMQDSPSSKTSGFEESKQEDHSNKASDKNANGKQHDDEEEEINFKESQFQIPPSFSQSITEETLHDDNWPYVFWASLSLLILKDPVNPMAAVYNALEEFIGQLVEEDPNFMVYPYHLSKYESVEDLPPPIETPDDLLDDIDEWLDYFPQAKLRISGGDTYMALLIGLSVPFPKLIKNLSGWMRNECFGLWKAYLQLEQPTSLGWLLFSTQMMNVELLQEAISDKLENIPVGLCWKTISQGLQGTIPKNMQVKALHVLVDKLDVPMAKPLLMALFMSNPSEDHQFPLHVRMRLVLEMDAILNMKG